MTASQLVAIASFYDNKYCQAFPAFGPARRGAPMRAYCKISEKPIQERTVITSSDYFLVLDSTLISTIKKTELKDGSVIMINSNKKPREFSLSKTHKVLTYDLNKVGMEVFNKPIVNTAMLGVFLRTTNVINISSLKKALVQKFEGEALNKNLEIIDKTRELVKKN